MRDYKRETEDEIINALRDIKTISRQENTTESTRQRKYVVHSSYRHKRFER